MEERSDDLAQLAGELSLLGVKAFMFLEGEDAVGGAQFPGDRPADRRRLRGLRRLGAGEARRTAWPAAAAYAAGGRAALEDHARRVRRGGARAHRSGAVDGDADLLSRARRACRRAVAGEPVPQRQPGEARQGDADGGRRRRASPGLCLLTLRGQVTLAALLAGFALWLLGKNRNPFGGLGGFGGFGGFNRGGFGQRAERRSSVRSAMVEMQLDLDSGAMAGTVLAGRFEGRRLDDLGIRPSSASCSPNAAASTRRARGC
jgi:hypothetical protein